MAYCKAAGGIALFLVSAFVGAVCVFRRAVFIVSAPRVVSKLRREVASVLSAPGRGLWSGVVFG